MSDGTKPIRRLTFDRQVELPGLEQFDALKSQPGAVHGVLGVEPVGVDEFLASASATFPVSAATQPIKRIACDCM
ncbi:MAG: hypothetical protein V9E94_06315 [Microthrixaceae bacterium]